MDYMDAVMVVIGLSSYNPIGRTVIQKLIYLASQKGVVEDTYFPHYYGPYSREVAGALSSAVSIDFVKETTEEFTEYDAKRYVYMLAKSGEDLYSIIKEEQTKDYEKLKEIVSICEKTARLNMQVLAGAAKVHYIINQEGVRMTFDEIKDATLKLKWNLSEDEINNAAKLLVELDLVQEVDRES